MNHTSPMNCEEFEIVGLDFECEGSLDDEGRQRASHHVRECARCAALQSSWSAGQMELRALGADSRDLAVPPRVETRLLQQFRLKHQSRRDRRAIRIAMCTLATAAVIVFTMGVWNLHQWHLRSLSRTVPQNSSQDTDIAKPAFSAVNTEASATEASSATLSARNSPIGGDAGDFTQLAGATFYGAEDGAVVRLGMQRSSLAAFGLPVNEERASDWIQVDVLVAADGSPQAFRLPQ